MSFLFYSSNAAQVNNNKNKFLKYLYNQYLILVDSVCKKTPHF